METTFRNASFMIFKLSLRENERLIKDIKAIETVTPADKQKKIDMLMSIRQIQHDTIQLAKNEYPHIDWTKELGQEIKLHVNREAFIQNKLGLC